MISVITSAFNAEKTIGETIDSVLSQTITDREYVVIDGKSRDRTLEIIGKRKDAIDRIISEPDTGIYNALNKGIRLSKGEIVGFLHADDVYENNEVLSRVAEVFRKEDADCVYGDLLYVSSVNGTVIRKWVSGKFSAGSLKYGWMPPHPSLFVHRRIYEKIGGFDETFRIAADYDFMLRMLSRPGIRVIYQPGVFVRMRVGGASNRSLGSILSKMREDYRILKKNGFSPLSGVFCKNIRKIPQLFLR